MVVGPSNLRTENKLDGSVHESGRVTDICLERLGESHEYSEAAKLEPGNSLIQTYSIATIPTCSVSAHTEEEVWLNFHCVSQSVKWFNLDSQWQKYETSYFVMVL